MAGQDKKLFKQISHDGKVDDLEALAPTVTHNTLPASFLISREESYGSYDGDSEGGVLCASISKKTLYYLKATLNTAFSPDYDFRYDYNTFL